MYLYHRKIDENKMLRPFVSERTEEVRLCGLKEWQEFVLNDYPSMIQDKLVPLKKVQEAVLDNTSLNRIGRIKFEELVNLYPERLRLTRPRSSEKREWFIEFL